VEDESGAHKWSAMDICEVQQPHSKENSNVSVVMMSMIMMIVMMMMMMTVMMIMMMEYTNGVLWISARYINHSENRITMFL
jgi:hypothetical protein